MANLARQARPWKGKDLLYDYDYDLRKTIYAYPADRTFVIDGVSYIVPAYYRFDGATVPRPLWWFFSPTGITFEPASVHDFLYDTMGRGLGLGRSPWGRHSLTRRQVDRLFFRHMRQVGTPWLQAALMWLGVRTPIGLRFWRKKSYPDYLVKN